MIKEGAKLVQSAEDVLEELRWHSSLPASKNEAPLPFSTSEAPLLAHLTADPCTLDELAARSGLGAAELLPRLLELELAGSIAALPGGRYQKLAAIAS